VVPCKNKTLSSLKQNIFS